MKHINDPYAQGYHDCKEGKEYSPHYWVSFLTGKAQLVYGCAMTNYDKGRYTLGWDAAIMGGAL